MSQERAGVDAANTRTCNAKVPSSHAVQLPSLATSLKKLAGQSTHLRWPARRQNDGSTAFLIKWLWERCGLWDYAICSEYDAALQSDRHKPPLGLCFPAAQSTQVSCAVSFWNRPLAHASHDVSCGPSAMKPAGQASQPCQNNKAPRKEFLCAESNRVPSLKDPAYCCVAPACRNSRAASCPSTTNHEQAPMPVALLNRPPGHASHACTPWSSSGTL